MALSRRKPWSRIRRFVRRGARGLKERVANVLDDLGSWLDPAGLEVLLAPSPPSRVDGRPAADPRARGVLPTAPVGPRPRPPRRPRQTAADAPPAGGEGATRLRRQWTCSQARSPLFARLPPELRARVFDHVLAGRFLQVVAPRGGRASPRSLGCSRDLYSHTHCAPGAGLSCVLLLFQQHRPWGSTVDADVPEAFRGAAAGRARGMLPLLMAWRRMYDPPSPLRTTCGRGS